MTSFCGEPEQVCGACGSWHSSDSVKREINTDGISGDGRASVDATKTKEKMRSCIVEDD